MRATINGLKRILLIVDQQLERERLAKVLAQDQYTVVQVNNGAEAYALFEQGEFDLVITDAKLPFINGYELARMIKKADPLQQILLVSELWPKPDPATPVDAVLLRSCRPQRLQQVVAELLAKRARYIEAAPAFDQQDSDDSIELVTA